MFDRTRIHCDCQASICLDCGADEAACNAGDLEISERGMRFASPWRFSLGSQLAVGLAFCGENGVRQRARAEGLVVECEETAPRHYLVTVLFLELSCESHDAITGISDRLETETEERAGFAF